MKEAWKENTVLKESLEGDVNMTSFKSNNYSITHNETKGKDNFLLRKLKKKSGKYGVFKNTGNELKRNFAKEGSENQYCTLHSPKRTDTDNRSSPKFRREAATIAEPDSASANNPEAVSEDVAGAGRDISCKFCRKPGGLDSSGDGNGDTGSISNISISSDASHRSKQSTDSSSSTKSYISRDGFGSVW